MQIRRRTTAGLGDQAARPAGGDRQIDLSSFLSSLRNTVGNSVDDFLTLGDVVRLRGCTTNLAAQYHPSRSPHLWRRIRPPFNVLHRAANNLTVSGATLIEDSFVGETKSHVRREIAAVACAIGNIALAEWGLQYYQPWPADEADRYPIGGDFREACKHGHVELANWFIARFGLTHDALPIYSLISARAADNVAMAQWLLDIGYVPGAIESGCALFIGACFDDNMRFAHWVLRTFPFTIDCERLNTVLSELCTRVPQSAQFLIEIFGIPWGDIAAIYPMMIEQLDATPELTSALFRKWLVSRYGEESSSPR